MSLFITALYIFVIAIFLNIDFLFFFPSQLLVICSSEAFGYVDRSFEDKNAAVHLFPLLLLSWFTQLFYFSITAFPKLSR